jgi:hypothetical protein
MSDKETVPTEFDEDVRRMVVNDAGATQFDLRTRINGLVRRSRGAMERGGQRAKKSLAGLGRYCGGLWRHRKRHWAPHLRHRCSGARWREWPRGGLPVGEYVRRLGSGGTVGQCWLQCSVLF